MSRKKVIELQRPTAEDKLSVKMLVRLRCDFQDMRKRMDNRMGRKADGTEQNIEERTFRPDDIENFLAISGVCKDQEDEIEKMLKAALKRFPIYTDFLVNTKGVGTISAGWIVAEIDPHKCNTISALWQFAGMNPGMVLGKKRKENDDGSFSYVDTDTLVRGDKLTPGFVAPFNKRLRVALCGVLADRFIMSKSPYALNYYYPYKARLEQSDVQVVEIAKGGKAKTLPWSEAKKAHRDRAAKRYMVKMFLKDLYVAWRTIEGLEVRPPYAEEYLGKVHHG